MDGDAQGALGKVLMGREKTGLGSVQLLIVSYTVKPLTSLGGDPRITPPMLKSDYADSSVINAYENDWGGIAYLWH